MAALDELAREMEQAINEVRGVFSCRVVDRGGRVDEVHVLASKERHPKQVVRDIESLLLLTFGVRLDYRKVSLVQVDGGRPFVLSGRVKLLGVDATEEAVEVRIRAAEKEHSGLAKLADCSSAAEAGARAVLQAIKRGGLAETALGFEDLKVVEVGRRQAVLCCIRTGEAAPELLLGTSFVEKGAAEAAARATLNAINRRVPTL